MTESESLAQRVLLLVDDEANIINALKRSLRRDGYQILTANGGAEGLEVLAGQQVGVIVSDQRMPHMTGAEFLSEVKALYPETMRIMLSGYTDLESVTSAINDGAIYKFLTKPWDDELLRDNIRKAFQHYEMARENQRLTQELRSANEELLRLNRLLERQVAEKNNEISRSSDLLRVSQRIFDQLPIAILVIDDRGMIAVANKRSDRMLCGSEGATVTGRPASRVLPETVMRFLAAAGSGQRTESTVSPVILMDGIDVRVWVNSVDMSENSSASVVVLSACKDLLSATPSQCCFLPGNGDA